MAIKTFTAGSVLTASDTNTFLANSGLVYVKSQTIGNGVFSVTVTDAFSSTYDNYLIQVSGGSASAGCVLGLRLGADVTGYRYQFIYGDWAGTALADGTTVGTLFQYVGGANTDGIHMNCTVNSPNLAKGTRVVADGVLPANYSGFMGGYKPTTTQYTSFIIVPSTGSLTGGTITVYGYRKA